MKKILFLDIDGVLNSRRSFAAAAPILENLMSSGCSDVDQYMTASCDPVAVQLVSNLLIQHDIFIVLSSSHRLRFLETVSGLAAAREFISRLGLPGGRLIGMTPADPDLSRGEQIQQWIFDNCDCVDSYAILDDADDFLPHQRERLVQTQMDLGVSADNYSQLLKLL